MATTTGVIVSSEEDSQFKQNVAIQQAYTGLQTANTNIAALQTSVAALQAAHGSVFLAALTASASATLDDTASITAAYDCYMFELVNLVPATNATTLLMQYQISAAFQTTSYLNLLTGAFTAGFNATGHASETYTFGIKLSGDNTAFNALGNTVNYGANGQIFLHAPNGADFKFTTGTVSWLSSAGTALNTATVGGTYNGATGAITGVRFKMASGNIASGSVRIFGLKTA